MKGDDLMRFVHGVISLFMVSMLIGLIHVIGVDLSAEVEALCLVLGACAGIISGE